MTIQQPPRYSHLSAIRTVAAREIQVALHTKALVISTILMFIVVVGGVFLLSAFDSDDEREQTLVTAGVDVNAVANVVGEGTVIIPVSDPDSAIRAVKDEGKDAAFIRTTDGFELISNGSSDSTLAAFAQIAATSITQNEALTAVGVSPTAFAAALPDSTVKTVDISADTTDDTQPAVVATMVGTIVVLTFIMAFAGNVGGRVTDEKSSRVVEIILATIRPFDLLFGKILAMTTIGVAGTAVILGSGLAAMTATGLLDSLDLAPATVGILLITFILGLLFFSSLYAAAGSLVSRAEELGSTQTPVMMLFFAVIYPPMFGIAALDSTLMQVLTWVPPMSMGIAPMQYAAGNISALELAGSFAILAATTLLVLAVVARIYRGSILHNGQKLGWLRAFRQAS